MVNLDKVLVEQVKSLKLVFKDSPQPELLLKIPNAHKEVKYHVDITTGEFTSLCPLNMSQPDYATLSIQYIPKEWCVELKSLKFYLVSFRMVPIFHEEVPAVISAALVNLLKPQYVEVIGNFSTRGGLDTKVRAVFGEPRFA